MVVIILLLSLLLVKSRRKKGAYTTDQGDFTPDPVLTSDNPAYGLAEPRR